MLSLRAADHSAAKTSASMKTALKTSGRSIAWSKRTTIVKATTMVLMQ